MKGTVFLLASTMMMLAAAPSVAADASSQLALSLREHEEKGEVYLDILVSNVSKSPVEIVSEGIRPAWSVWAWFDWTVDGKQAKYSENVAGFSRVEESWRVPPRGVILWAAIPLRLLQITTKHELRPAITDRKRHVVRIMPTERWKGLAVAPGQIEVGEKDVEPTGAAETPRPETKTEAQRPRRMAQTAWGNQVRGLRVRLALQTGTVAVGEPVPAAVTIENLGTPDLESGAAQLFPHLNLVVRRAGWVKRVSVPLKIENRLTIKK